MAELDIVIPTLNEAAQLPGLLTALQRQRDIDAMTFVADGGSSDATRQLAEQAGAQTLLSAAGRGRQLNTGAAAGQAPWLLFLHADSRPGGTTLLRRALDRLGRLNANAGHDRHAGHFPLRFRRRRNRQDFFYHYLESKSALNRPETCNGDQGLLLTRRYFEELGGYPQDLPFLEDQYLGDRIRESGAFVTLPGRLQTSARRFETEGTAPRYFLMTLIMTARHAGLKEFFDGAPELYRRQDQTTRLDLGPFIELFANAAQKAGPQVWERIGAYGLDNLWQAALALDLALGADRRLLNWHDRWLAPALLRSPLPATAGQLLRFGVLAPLRGLLGRRQQPTGRDDGDIKR